MNKQTICEILAIVFFIAAIALSFFPEYHQYIIWTALASINFQLRAKLATHAECILLLNKAVKELGGVR